MADLATTLASTMNSLVNGKSPGASAQNMLSGGTINTDSFMSSIDTTAILTTGNGVVIATDASYSYILCTVHAGTTVSTVSCVNSDSETETRTGAGMWSFPGNATLAPNDLAIVKVPAFSAKVTPAKLLPANTLDYLNPQLAANIPVVQLNRLKSFSIRNWYQFFAGEYTNGTVYFANVNMGSAFNAWAEDAVTGDSSSPDGLVIDGQFAVLEAITYDPNSTNDGGVAAFKYIDAINAGIASLGGTATVQTVDLSAYDANAWVPPVTPDPPPEGNLVSVVATIGPGGDYTDCQYFLTSVLDVGTFAGAETVTAKLLPGFCGTVTGSSSVDAWGFDTFNLTSDTPASLTTNTTEATTPHIVGTLALSTTGSAAGTPTTTININSIQFGGTGSTGTCSINLNNELVNCNISSNRVKETANRGGSHQGISVSSSAANTTATIRNNVVYSTTTQTGTTTGISYTKSGSNVATLTISGNKVDYTNYTRGYVISPSGGTLVLASGSGANYALKAHPYTNISSSTQNSFATVSNAGVIATTSVSPNVATDKDYVTRTQYWTDPANGDFSAIGAPVSTGGGGGLLGMNLLL